MSDLSPALLARAREQLDGHGPAVVEARDAATVVLLRDSAGGPEVYLLRRVGSMAFAAGMHVFPGGSVDPRDATREVGWIGQSPSVVGSRLGCAEPLARALVCAAVRETFEESGVLLAGTPSGELVADTSDESWEVDRLALLDRTLSLADMLLARDLAVRADLLAPWAHWLTPEFEPRRFDTRFFVAAVPAGQRTRDVGGEADAVTWLPVADAVRDHEAGDLAMLPPTIVTLREVAMYADVAAVLDASLPIRPVMPRPVLDGEQVRLVVDTDAGPVDCDEIVRAAGAR